MTLNTIVQAAPNQVSCDLGGEAAILNLSTGVYCGLDPVGATIWGLLAQATSVAALRDAILAEYEVSRDRCESDLFELLSKLAATGLIQVRDAQTP